MPLLSNRYGKGRVRVARVLRDGDRHEIRELSVRTILKGDFAAAYTHGDNRTSIATDTIKNLTNIVAHEQPGAGIEAFAQALAARLLDRYPQIQSATVTCEETKWLRATIAGRPHDNTFLLDSNGKPHAHIEASRTHVQTTSGITDFTFMKTTQSGWVGYPMDEVTTLKETTDRIAATAMNATWTWNTAPADYESANATILAAMLEVFATTYSRGIQDSLYRMAEAALAAIPELQTITLACPNKHYLPIDLSRFDLPPSDQSSDNTVFTPTDEPHGQIECTVGR